MVIIIRGDVKRRGGRGVGAGSPLLAKNTFFLCLLLFVPSKPVKNTIKLSKLCIMPCLGIFKAVKLTFWKIIIYILWCDFGGRMSNFWTDQLLFHYRGSTQKNCQRLPCLRLCCVHHPKTHFFWRQPLIASMNFLFF